MKERDYTLDLVRVVACLLVLLMHSLSPDSGLGSIHVVGIYTFTKPCNDLFFMVSGALLLPVKLSYKDFLKRRLSKVVWPTLIFTLFYIALKCCTGEITLSETTRLLLSMPFAPTGHGIMWFMYTMIGIYLLAPIVTPFLEKATKREFQFVLLLWMVTLFLPYLQLFLDVRTDVSSTLYNFGGCQGFFLLGYYLRKYPVRVSLWILASMFVLAFAIQLGLSLASIDVGQFYLSPVALLLSIFFYQVIMQYVKPEKISDRMKKVVVDFSNCSFGIYLLQILILFRILYHSMFLASLNPYLNVTLTFLITLITTWLIAHIISYSKYGKYIIGYSRKR